MGFWHTGYLDLHEPAGLGEYKYKPKPPEFTCGICNAKFGTQDGLRQHRFEGHPLTRPVMLLRGREGGSRTILVTQPISADDIILEACKTVTINGNVVPKDKVQTYLSQVTSDVITLVLTGDEVSTSYKLDFQIAQESDLQGVESEFDRLVSRKQLDARAIDELIRATSIYSSASRYCDGICSYLYGVLAKEAAPSVHLPYVAYIKKFNAAVEALSPYDRPLAKILEALVCFHFNHFEDAVTLDSESRVGYAALHYLTYLTTPETPFACGVMSQNSLWILEQRVTDFETEQIIRWTVNSPAHPVHQTEDMENFLRKAGSEYDRAKVRVLLTEIYTSLGNHRAASNHARALRNVPAFELWAETKIRKSSRSEK